jgi:soluble P-type ATPase
MLEIEIPGNKSLRLADLILDYNGTIAVDGKIMDGVKELLEVLSRSVVIHILTADTFGSVRNQLAGIACQLSIIPLEDQVQAKVEYLRQLGCEGAVCIGNGRNDVLMLKEAALGIAVIQSEGGCAEAVLAADVLTTSVLDALDLLIHPLRLTATLRS